MVNQLIPPRYEIPFPSFEKRRGGEVDLPQFARLAGGDDSVSFKHQTTHLILGSGDLIYPFGILYKFVKDLGHMAAKELAGGSEVE